MVLVSPLTQEGTSFCRLMEVPKALVKRRLITAMESFILARYMSKARCVKSCYVVLVIQVD